MSTTNDLMTRARARDGAAFQTLTEPHRRELLVHCYRMLGSLQDAEDALQDTLLDAWQGLDRFQARASMRTWLYRIATNRCLSALRSARRRPAKAWDIPAIEPPEPSRLGELVWLEPFPDAVLEGVINAPLGPEEHYAQTEAISLAFITALQVLPARQRAVLILRDVLGYHANEVAQMLDSTVESVTSALKRARANLERQVPPEKRGADLTRGSAAEQELVGRFVKAFQSGDLGALVALLTEDVRLSMPPIPLEYHGRDAVARFYATVFEVAGHYDLVPTRANGQLAFGAYLHGGAGGIRHGAGLLVLTVTAGRICALTRFDNDVLASFGLPRSLSG